jgi:triacylglycerol lipase
VTRNVVLVHGYRDHASQFRRLAADLRAAGLWPVCPDLHPNDGRLGLEASGEQLRDYVDATIGSEERFAVVAFSMGALIARYYLQCLGGSERATAFYAISCPHRGTWWGHVRITPGVAQMRPGSAFLQSLAATEDRLASLTLVSARTPFDLTVVPASTSVWPMASNQSFPVLVHALMPSAACVRRDVVHTLT